MTLYPVHMASTQSLALPNSDAPSALHQVALSALKVVACSVIIAAGAQIELKLPYTPVPITGQSLSVVIAGLTFGRKIAVAGAVAYLCEGMMGLPVFSGGGSGIHHFAGPTGGYLIGFLPAAFVAGLARDKGITLTPIGVFLTVLASSVPIFALGVLKLALTIGNLSAALQAGLYPFIPGDFIKALLASMLTPIITAKAPRLK
jgi:biotin transport system substrate-specific component